MKKENPTLKKALEEAARQELASLPKENQVIRPYSQKFENEMNVLLGKEDTAVNRKKPRVKVATLIAAVLVVCLTLGTVSAVVNIGSYYTQASWTVVGSTAPSEDAIGEITYDGEEIVINYTSTIAENAKYPDSGIIITLNGVRQTFDVKTKGDRAKNVDMYTIEAKPGETQNVQFSFTPNIGKKGDVMALSLLKLYDPEKKSCPDFGIMGHIDENDDDICDKCSLLGLTRVPLANSLYYAGLCKLTMAVDAPKEIKICEDFSGVTISPVEEIIRDCYNYEKITEEGIFNEYDNLIAPTAFIYNDYENQIVYDKDAYYSDEQTLRYTTSTLSASENEKLSVNIHGKGGKYRVSFYIDTEIQPVFDGCDYLDIEFADGEQVVLDLNIDTTDMQGKHKCFVLLKPLDNMFENVWDRIEHAYFPDTLVVE